MGTIPPRRSGRGMLDRRRSRGKPTGPLRRDRPYWRPLRPRRCVHCAQFHLFSLLLDAPPRGETARPFFGARRSAWEKKVLGNLPRKSSFLPKGAPSPHHVGGLQSRGERCYLARHVTIPPSPRLSLRRWRGRQFLHRLGLVGALPRPRDRRADSVGTTRLSPSSFRARRGRMPAPVGATVVRAGGGALAPRLVVAVPKVEEGGMKPDRSTHTLSPFPSLPPRRRACTNGTDPATRWAPGAVRPEGDSGGGAMVIRFLFSLWPPTSWHQVSQAVPGPMGGPGAGCDVDHRRGGAR